MKRITLKYVNETLKPMGIIVKREDGEYIVNYNGATSRESAYYTDNIEDALNTGISMYSIREAIKGRGNK